MENILKKMMYTGVGFASLAIDKFQTAINELIKDGKLSEEEGKKLVDEFVKTSKSKKDEYEKEMNDLINKIIQSFNFVNKSDIDKLKNRVSVLETLIKNYQTVS